MAGDPADGDAPAEEGPKGECRTEFCRKKQKQKEQQKEQLEQKKKKPSSGGATSDSKAKTKKAPRDRDREKKMPKKKKGSGGVGRSEGGAGGAAGRRAQRGGGGKRLSSKGEDFDIFDYSPQLSLALFVVFVAGAFLLFLRRRRRPSKAELAFERARRPSSVSALLLLVLVFYCLANSWLSQMWLPAVAW